MKEQKKTMANLYIQSTGTSGKPDGGVYAVSPSGNVVSTRLVPLKGGGVGLKPGWRAATQADIDNNNAPKRAEANAKAAAKKEG